jgi:uncharacterized BrkB/YihY/UPF0761 family membrane protein
MPRGGCNNCLSGGGQLSNSVYILLTLGVFLIIMGIVVHNKNILDISINAINRSDFNDYLGYTSIVIGVILVFIAAMSLNQQ